MEEIVWDILAASSTVVALRCFFNGNCSDFLRDKSGKVNPWMVKLCKVLSTLLVFFVLFARKLREFAFVQRWMEKWRRLNPRFRVAASFVFTVVNTFHSSLLDTSFEDEAPDTSSVIYAFASVLLSLCLTRRICFLEDFIFYFMGLFIGYMFKIDKLRCGLSSLIISICIILVYCCGDDPDPHPHPPRTP